MTGSSAGFFARLFRKRGGTAGRDGGQGVPAGGQGKPVATEPDPAPLPGSTAGLHAAALPVDGGAQVADAGAGDGQQVPAGATGTVTVVALEAHAGLATLCAALEYRLEGQGMLIRGAGPGLMRAAFDGMLKDTDVLVLLAPPAAEATGSFGEKLEWLEANGNAGLVERTVFVVNYGTALDGGALELPASLTRPVVVLPHDAALGLPAAERRAPRREARHALDQLVSAVTGIAASRAGS